MHKREVSCSHQLDPEHSNDERREGNRAPCPLRSASTHGLRLLLPLRLRPPALTRGTALILAQSTPLLLLLPCPGPLKKGECIASVAVEKREGGEDKADKGSNTG